jgi:alkanesulfonate monooxygenase SsuD/methylene tetrahydromethanopterin reductase-like flavin-dependent oxidoreductase (luciferase family)
MVNTLLFGGFDKTKLAFEAYKRARVEAGLPPPSEDRFSYLAFCYVGDTDEEALRIGQKIAWFVTVSMKQPPQYNRFLPGQVAPELAPKVWRGGTGRAPTDLRAERLVAQGKMFAGNPDTVVRQIKRFRRRVGGLGRLIMMTRQGLVTHEEAQKSFRLAATEVLPQLQDLEPLEQPELAAVT